MLQDSFNICLCTEYSSPTDLHIIMKTATLKLPDAKTGGSYVCFTSKGILPTTNFRVDDLVAFVPAMICSKMLKMVGGELSVVLENYAGYISVCMCIYVYVCM